jgi:hypothetical protein
MGTRLTRLGEQEGGGGGVHKESTHSVKKSG